MDMMHLKKRSVSGMLIGFQLFIAAFLGFNSIAEGYVIPPEQLLEFMSKEVPGFNSVEIGWTSQSNEVSGDTTYTINETVWFRSPNLLRVIREEGVVQGEDVAGLGAGYLGLFCGKPAESKRLLIRLGVPSANSSYTRIGGKVAYRIGSQAGDGPMLLLEKDRFLPVLLVFEPPNDRTGELARVRFKDYRKVGDGWFPFEIHYDGPSGVTEAYLVRQVMFNRPPPVERPESPRIEAPESPGEERPSNAVKEGEGDRLKRVIRAFEEKFGENGAVDDSQ
jgi:hypothetical protein